MKYRPPLAAITRLALMAPLLAGLAGPAFAQTAATAGPSEITATLPAPVIEDPARLLLLSFGNHDGLSRLSERFVDRLRADPRHDHLFKNVPPAQLKQGLADQFCRVLQGPCASSADTRLGVAALSTLGRTDVLAMMPALQDSMNAQAVPPAAQAALLARLAPLHGQLAAR